MATVLEYNAKMFYDDAERLCHPTGTLTERVKDRQYDSIFAVPRGGYALAAYLSRHFGIPLVDTIDVLDFENVLVVDDVIDSGATRQEYTDFDFVALHNKIHSKYKATPPAITIYANAVDSNVWIKYPWEKNESTIKECVTRMIEVIGENPNRSGLIDTPDRVDKMFKQIFRGYNPKEMPKITTFDNDKESCEYVNSLIIDKGYFFSYCEHHMVPFFGQYYFGYIPNCAIVGASKIARTIDYYAAKLQIQERLAIEVVNKMEEVLQPHGLILMLRARHLCKEMRGVCKHNSPFETIEARGWLLENRNGSKDEFIARCGVPDIV